MRYTGTAVDLYRTIDYLERHLGNDGLDHRDLFARGSKLQGLAHDLSARLELPVEVLDPFRSIKVDTRKFDPDYLSEIMPEMAVAVGLAMRGVN